MPNCIDKSFHVHPGTQSCGELRHGVSTSQLLTLRDSGRQISPHKDLTTSSSEQPWGSPFTNEDQSTNRNPILTNLGSEDIASAGVSTLSGSAPPNQQNIEENFPADPEMQEVQQCGLTSTTGNVVGDITRADADYNCIRSDGRLVSSESQVPIRATSRPSSSYTQPQSHHINATISAVKDVPDNRDQFQQTSEPPATKDHYNSKMKKSKPGYNHNIVNITQGYGSPSIQQERHLSKVAQAQQSLVKHNQEIEDILNHAERQKEIIQFLQSELERLKASGVENIEKVQALEMEKVTLKAKIQKFERLSIKYKDHMNEVVISQKHLFKESQRMQSVQNDMKIFQEAYVTREAHIKKLQCLLREATEFRAPAEKLLTGR